jgi:hypothetical protein
MLLSIQGIPSDPVLVSLLLTLRVSVGATTWCFGLTNPCLAFTSTCDHATCHLWKESSWRSDLAWRRSLRDIQEQVSVGYAFTADRRSRAMWMPMFLACQEHEVDRRLLPPSLTPAILISPAEEKSHPRLPLTGFLDCSPDRHPIPALARRQSVGIVRDHPEVVCVWSSPGW